MVILEAHTLAKILLPMDFDPKFKILTNNVNLVSEFPRPENLVALLIVLFLPSIDFNPQVRLIGLYYQFNKVFRCVNLGGIHNGYVSVSDGDIPYFCL